MKLTFVDELVSTKRLDNSCDLTGRVSAVRAHKTMTFVDVVDHTGRIQAVIDNSKVDGSLLEKLQPGAYISLKGCLCAGKKESIEINVDRIDVLAQPFIHLSPTPWQINGLDPDYGRQVFGFPSFYLANPQRAAVLKIKTNFVNALHHYFQANRFTLVEPPILTDKTLYDERTAVTARVHGENVFLSQCATFELEPLAMVYGKVYTISPAFRNEKAGSKRHLAEYTHAKAEVLLATIDDLMFLAGDALYHSLSETVAMSERELALLGKEIDFESIHPSKHIHITYDEALKITQAKGSDTKYGEGLTRRDEILLTAHAGNKYLWMQFPPFTSEGFPYRRKTDQRHLSMTCDLIAPHGAGEMIGVAEKTTDAEELIQNLVEKGKEANIRDYWEYILLRRYGLPQHGGLGAAPERIIYGLLGLDHIRLTKPWPRYPDRRIRSDANQPLEDLGDLEMRRLMGKYHLR
jgi:asparaginyl-tRNA synthetase